MIRPIRKLVLMWRIRGAQEDQKYWKSGIRISTAELANAEKLESALRQELISVDHPLPKILRTRGLT
jgi:hypothetical protein